MATRTTLKKTTFPDHDSSISCWCQPQIIWRDPWTGDVILVHRVWQ